MIKKNYLNYQLYNLNSELIYLLFGTSKSTGQLDQQKNKIILLIK